MEISREVESECYEIEEVVQQERGKLVEIALLHFLESKSEGMG
jgi:hypothetical protein